MGIGRHAREEYRPTANISLRQKAIKGERGWKIALQFKRQRGKGQENQRVKKKSEKARNSGRAGILRRAPVLPRRRILKW